MKTHDAKRVLRVLLHLWVLVCVQQIVNRGRMNRGPSACIFPNVSSNLSNCPNLCTDSFTQYIWRLRYQMHQAALSCAPPTHQRARWAYPEIYKYS